MSRNSRTSERRKRKAELKQPNEQLSVATGDYSLKATLNPLSSLAEKLTPDTYTRIVGIVGSQRNRKGSGPRSPIYDNGSVDFDLVALLDNARSETRGYYPSLIQHTDERVDAIEASERTKFGPYIDANWKAIKGKFLEYLRDYKPFTLEQQNRLREYGKIVSREIREASGGELIPLTVEEGYAAMTKSTFYGFPHFSSQWSEEDALCEEIQTFASHFMAGNRDVWEDYIHRPWCVFSRVIPNGEHSKVRATMAPSKVGSLIEKLFTDPVIRAFKLTRWGSGYAGNHAVGPKIRHDIRHADHVLSLDYSAFDQTLSAYARSVVCDVLVDVFGSEFTEHLETMFKSFEKPDFITPDGIVTPLNPIGLGSGIGPTGIIGTIWNRIMYYAVREECFHGEAQQTVQHYGYGDDTLLAWRGDKVDLSAIQHVIESYGMVFNPAKQTYTSGKDRYGSFLSMWYLFSDKHKVTARGFYSIYRAWNRVIYSDVTKSRDMDVVREMKVGKSYAGCDMLDVISVLENCNGHPDFHILIDLVAKGHPLQLHPAYYLSEEDWVRVGNNKLQGMLNFGVVKYMSWKCREISPPHETNWYRYSLRKYCDRVFSTKGIVLKATQAISYLKGERVEWDDKQLLDSQSFGLEKGGKSLAERVIEVVARKGVTLAPYQITQLRVGGKIEWTEAQIRDMSIFGQLTDIEKESIVAKLTPLHRSVHVPEVSFDFEVFWLSVHNLLYPGISDLVYQAS